MQQKTITVTITEDGNSTIDLDGFPDNTCAKALKDFQGDDLVQVERNKSAFYRSARNDDRQQMKR